MEIVCIVQCIGYKSMHAVTETVPRYCNTVCPYNTITMLSNPNIFNDLTTKRTQGKHRESTVIFVVQHREILRSDEVMGLCSGSIVIVLYGHTVLQYLGTISRYPTHMGRGLCANV